MSRPTVIDLFCGCGGFSLGAHRAGFETVLGVDIDATLTSSYSINYPHARLLNANLAEASSSELLDAAGTSLIDGLVGGPPCQGFSEIGRRAVDDPRNLLIDHFFRHVAAISPRFFVMENVPGLLFEKTRHFVEAALEKVSHKYVILEPLAIDASDYGAATKRKRIILIGYDPSRCARPTTSDLASWRRPATTVRDAISDLPEPSGPSEPSPKSYAWAHAPRQTKLSQYAKSARTIPPNGPRTLGMKMLRKRLVSGLTPTTHTSAVTDRWRLLEPGQVDKVSRFPRLSWDAQCTTLRAGTGPERGGFQSVRPIHPEQDRVITVREAARLQGFPDWYLFHPSKWHSFRMIGNSVSPFMSEAIMRMLYAAVAASYDRYGGERERIEEPIRGLAENPLHVHSSA